MKEGMNGTHTSSNTDILLESTRTVRSGGFQGDRIIGEFHFSMCSSGFKVAMRGNIF